MNLNWLRRAAAGGWAIAFVGMALLATARNAGARVPAVYQPNFDSKNIHVLYVRGNVYMLVGAGSNITVQVGEQYVIVVDTGLPQFSD